MNSAMSMKQQEHKMNPKKFNVWLIMVGSIMLFAGLTSAFLVRKAEGNWEIFDLPVQFMYSLIVVFISSLTMWLAYRSAKTDELGRVKALLGTTFLLGALFVYFQLSGWMDLGSRGVFFVPEAGSDGSKISGSFVLLLAAVHLAHIIGGLVFVGIVLVKSLNLKVHKKNLLSIELCNTYWHFIGILWIYLYLFLYFAPQL